MPRLDGPIVVIPSGEIAPNANTTKIRKTFGITHRLLQNNAYGRVLTYAIVRRTIGENMLPGNESIDGMWPEAYSSILDRLDTLVSSARPTLCGLSACVDATISLHDAAALFDAANPPEVTEFAAVLLRRVEAGIGGEIRVEWPGGPAWLDRRLPFALDLGGTAPHVARILTVIGAPTLLALQTRSPEQLAVLPREFRLAHDGRAVPVQSIEPDHPNSPRIYIFEYTKNRRIGSVTPPRSSRIIVRFNDPGIEHDGEFAALSCRLAPDAGAALLSGFNTVPGDDLVVAVTYARDLAANWSAAGISVIHLELAGYDRPEYRDHVLAGLRGTITSLGLSLSEFNALSGDDTLASAMCALGERLTLRRVCVHADDWSVTATLDDPSRERDALLMGSLLASTRAAHGRPVFLAAIPAGATFGEPPQMPRSIGAWHLVVCATPYLAQPAATVGLGDTFTGGCLLILGQTATPKPATQNDAA